MLNAMLALLCVTALAVALSVLVMIYGWGLTPQSWWWIIGGGVFGQLFIRFVFSRIELPQKRAK
jgi:hypothetical protein